MAYLVIGLKGGLAALADGKVIIQPLALKLYAAVLIVGAVDENGLFIV